MSEDSNSAIRSARAHIKTLEKALAEMRAFKQEWETASKAEARARAFSDAGLPGQWSKFYQGDDLDPETVQTWAAQQGLASQEPEPTEPKPRPQAFVTPTVQGSPVGPAVITMDDINAAIARGDDDFINRAAAAEAAHPGSIQFKHPEAHTP